MKLIFTIQHPAHVHLFRNAIQQLKQDGHQVHVYARDKDIAINLLNAYNIDHTILAGDADSLGKLAVTQAKYEYKLAYEAWRIKPDVMIAMGEPGVAHVSKLIGARSIIFTDTESATLQNKLTFPFADQICTPECYPDLIGPKQTFYPGYHELAYLHPNRFEPDPSLVEDAGIDPQQPFVIVRLVAWNAAHDVGHSGFSSPVEVIKKIEQTGADVIITSESDNHPELNSNMIDIPPEDMHHFMHFSNLFIGESATMASECAILGTPSIYVASSGSISYTKELQSCYGLMYNYSGPDRQIKSIRKAIEILDNYDDGKWRRRHEKLLDDKIDTTNFIIDMIENNGSNYDKSKKSIGANYE